MMNDRDDITHRLAAAATTLDHAIDRYATGSVRIDSPGYAHVLTRVAAGAILAGGAVAIPLVAARGGEDDRGSPGPSPTESVTRPPESATMLPTGPTLPADGQTFTDDEAWDAVDWLFGLTPYGPDGDRYHHLIIQDQLEACMNERGFEYHQYPFTPRNAGGDGHALLPSLPTEADVRTAGYAALTNPGPLSAPEQASDTGQVPATTDPELIDATAANDALAEDPEWTLALYGDDTKVGTCTGEAWAYVERRVGTEAQERYGALSPTIATLTSPVVTPDGRLADAIAAWRQCMGTLGQEVPNPFEAAALYFRQPGTAPSDEEIATALEDLRCRRSSGFRDAYRDAMAAGIANFRFENQARIDDLVEATQRESAALRQLAEELGLVDS